MSAIAAIGKGILGMSGSGGDGPDVSGNKPVANQGDVPSQSGASNAASNFGAIGGALDSLNISVTGMLDRIRRRKQAELAQANLDRAFDENLRRFGLNFALQEFSTRKGIDMQEAQMMFNQQAGKAAQGAALQTQGLQRRAMSMDLKEKKRKLKIAAAFAGGFAKASVGGK